MAEGLILSDGKRKPLEKISEEHFQDLMWMSFFQDSGDFDNGDISGYRMHKIIHDLAQSVAGNESIILEKGLPSGSLAQTRHASVICDFKSPEIPQALCEAKHLRTLVLFPGGDTTEFLNQLFKSCPSLRVLDTNRSGLHLVHSIRNFLYLRYLDLSYTLIRFLPYGTVEQLPFLQTLNLCGCYNLKELPLIAKMMSLRHLNIPECESLTLQTLPTIMVGGFLDLMFLGSLNLRGELKIIHLENVSNSNDTKNANLMEKDGLDSLGLYWREKDDSSILKLMQEDLKPTFFKREQQQSAGSSEQHQPDANAAEEVVKGLQPHQNLKILVVEGYPGKRFPHWTVPNLTKVDLRDRLNCNCLAVLGNLLFLKTLFLHGMLSLKHIGTEFYGEDTRQLFPSLEELVLSDFLNLQEWLGPDGKDTFPKLSKLIVKRCPKLTSMPLLASLLHLELRDCSEVLFNSIRSASLTVLAIEKIADFSPLSGGILVNNPFLSSLEITACQALCFPPSELGNLATLKSLKIRWCEELSSFQQGFQNLKALEFLEICNCLSIISIPEGIGSLTSLRSLSIENCDNLTSLPLSLKNLKCLEHLTIMTCPNLVSLPEDMH
ncbi:disease resistance protein RGA2-like [Hevea brasiliensis]|uniref:disease resistance protein RGA2-like n=1 Tax=Hevea brasiliensis TaxID=3981 RepID=UPI0025D40B5D|nr:disease resistance protein RGA2-like [Hevea brasiliensis]